MVRTISEMCSDAVALRDECRFYASMSISKAAELRVVENEILHWTEEDD